MTNPEIIVYVILAVLCVLCVMLGVQEYRARRRWFK